MSRSDGTFYKSYLASGNCHHIRRVPLQLPGPVSYQVEFAVAQFFVWEERAKRRNWRTKWTT